MRRSVYQAVILCAALLGSSQVLAKVEVQAGQHKTLGRILVAKVSEEIVPGDYEALLKGIKANPGKYSYGTYGAGTSSHIQGELLNTQGGLDMTHVPFQGAAPLVVNMKGGQLPAAFIDSATVRPHLASFKVLAVTGTQRMPALPDVPTFAEQGFHSYDPLGWFGLLMPAGVPKPVLDKFSAEVARVLQLPDVRARIEGLGLFVGGETPEEFAKVMRSDADIYARIIKQANIKLN